MEGPVTLSERGQEDSVVGKSDLHRSSGKAEGRASRSSRCYAPLPLQMKRLFFSRDAKDLRICGRSLTLLHRDPNFYVIDDFLTESEYEYFEQLIDQQFGKFRASYTDEGIDDEFVSQNRTSAFISLRKSGSRQLRSVEARAAEIVGLSPENVEPLQMVGYRQHDKFDLHHDMGTYDDETGDIEAVTPRRLVTVFLYLNNLPEGQGHTSFPKIGVSVQPKRLRAVLFCNVLENGEPDPRAVHRADPVTEPGMLKFGINVWITDKNLQALTFSNHGAVLCNIKPPGKRTILSMLDEPCEICRGRHDAEKILLCDRCDLGYHMFCLEPPLKSVPKKAWMGPCCVGKRPKRGEYCETCGGGSKPHLILLCDSCGRAYHTYCLDPPLPRVPEGNFICPHCVKSRQRRAADEAEERRACGGCGGKDNLETILLCDFKGCDGEWHLACLNPPLDKVPEGDWFCPKHDGKDIERVSTSDLSVGVYVLLKPDKDAAGSNDVPPLGRIEGVADGGIIKVCMLETLPRGVTRSGIKYRWTGQIVETNTDSILMHVVSCTETTHGVFAKVALQDINHAMQNASAAKQHQAQ